MTTPDPWTGFVDAFGPLPDSPLVGTRAVRDDELTTVAGYPDGVRLVLSSGAGGLAGPGRWCARHEVEVDAVDVALRDHDDPAGNAARVVAALHAATDEGALPEDTVTHVRVAGAAPTPSWLTALDVLAEAEAVVCLPLDAVPDVDAWVDAAMDRETPVSLVGGTAEQAAGALAVAARLWGDPDDLVRARRWCRGWLTDDLDAALAHLRGLGGPR